MSIDKEKNGTYTVRYYQKDVITGKNIPKKKRGFETKASANEFQNSVCHKSTSLLFFNLFLKSQMDRDCNNETKKDEVRLIEKHLPIFKTIRYDELTKQFLKETRVTISNLNLSNVRKNKIISIIKKTCAYAYETYDLPNNSFVMKPFKITKKEMEIWEPEEFIKFENACKEIKPDFVALFHTMYYTGLRKGEVKALMVENYDEQNGYLHVKKGMRRGINSYGKTKNPQSVRTVKIDNDTNELLKPLKSNEKWLFGDCKPLTNTTIDRWFKKCIVAAGIKQIRIHDLRHSHLSYLIGNNIDAVTVAKRAGHKDVATTLNTYSHALKSGESKVIDLLDNMQNDSLKDATIN